MIAIAILILLAPWLYIFKKDPHGLSLFACPFWLAVLLGVPFCGGLQLIWRGLPPIEDPNYNRTNAPLYEVRAATNLAPVVYWEIIGYTSATNFDVCAIGWRVPAYPPFTSEDWTNHMDHVNPCLGAKCVIYSVILFNSPWYPDEVQSVCGLKLIEVVR